MGENQNYFFEFAEYRLDPSEHRLTRDGKVVPLTPKAFETLRLLVENGGHLLEKERLMEMLWADAFVEEGNLVDNISKIRQALGDSRKTPKYIETVSGRGYRFIADVRKKEEQSATAVDDNESAKVQGDEGAGFFQTSAADYLLPHESAVEITDNQPPAQFDPTRERQVISLSPLNTRQRSQRRRSLLAIGAIILVGSLL